MCDYVSIIYKNSWPCYLTARLRNYELHSNLFLLHSVQSFYIVKNSFYEPRGIN